MDVETGEQIVSYDNCKCHAVSFFIFLLIYFDSPDKLPQESSTAFVQKVKSWKVFLNLS